MDLLLFAIGLICVLTGIVGAILPALPGPPFSWLGLLLLYLTDSIPMNYFFISITFIIATAVYVIDLVLPAWGTKKYGGSKEGSYGALIGIFAALFIPIFGPFGFIVFPFIGAFIGELIFNPNSQNKFKSAMGSLIGILAGTILKLTLAFSYFYFFVNTTWQHRIELF